jgi:hypothetical protein
VLRRLVDMTDLTGSQAVDDAEERLGEIKTVNLDENAAAPSRDTSEQIPHSIFTVREKWMIVSMGAIAGFFRFVPCIYPSLQIGPPTITTIALWRQTSIFLLYLLSRLLFINQRNSLI